MIDVYSGDLDFCITEFDEDNYKPFMTPHPITKFDYPPEAIIATRIPSSKSAGGQSTSECILDPKHKRTIYRTPGFPSPIPNFTKSYEILDAGYMGLGMFATRDIKSGETILIERPLLVLPRSVSEGVFDIIVRRMSKADRKAYLQLENVHWDNVRFDGPLGGIALTNGVNVYELGGTKLDLCYCCVMRDISRVNHSCVPNATLLQFDEASFSFTLCAGKDIAKGEQIFRYYFESNTGTLEKRTRDLIRRYAIICKCYICCLTGNDLVACDEFRSKLDGRIASLTNRASTLEGFTSTFHKEYVLSLVEEAKNIMAELFRWKMEVTEHSARVSEVMTKLTYAMLKAYSASGVL